MDSSLYDPIRTMAAMTNEVIVAFSGGKESCVLLDLCTRFFDRVEAFFMYQVPGMSFQEKTLKWYEDKYSISIKRLPHFGTSRYLRYGVYREPDFEVPIIGMNDIYDFMRDRTGVYWIAAGERCADSIWRNAMIKHSGSIDETRGRFFPLAYWNKKETLEYIRVKKLYLGGESRWLGHSFAEIQGRELAMIKKHYPSDLERVKNIYPLCEGAIRRYEQYGENKV